jgi:hypothetical protein
MRSTFSICKGLLKLIPLPPDWALLALLAAILIIGWFMVN